MKNDWIALVEASYDLDGSEVVSHLVVGSTNSDIAHRRRTSEHTVANQVQAIFLKLGVHSRAELAARLQATA